MCAVYNLRETKAYKVYLLRKRKNNNPCILKKSYQEDIKEEQEKMTEKPTGVEFRHSEM